MQGEAVGVHIGRVRMLLRTGRREEGGEVRGRKMDHHFCPPPLSQAPPISWHSFMAEGGFFFKKKIASIFFFQNAKKKVFQETFSPIKRTNIMTLNNDFEGPPVLLMLEQAISHIFLPETKVEGGCQRIAVVSILVKG